MYSGAATNGGMPITGWARGVGVSSGGETNGDCCWKSLNGLGWKLMPVLGVIRLWSIGRLGVPKYSKLIGRGAWPLKRLGGARSDGVTVCEPCNTVGDTCCAVGCGLGSYVDEVFFFCSLIGGPYSHTFVYLTQLVHVGRSPEQRYRQPRLFQLDLRASAFDRTYTPCWSVGHSMLTYIPRFSP